ncbi:hypothetical protein CDAR_177461 [Caerostris darwini]|uniref:Uncharacterized protein n=1 Tax=Caerostris darwini TaxID=1538125 RepID=A0AAV4P1L7_9ARAC|nr:hypothetical protein CDAR_177461 [Caerostris darwini]
MLEKGPFKTKLMAFRPRTLARFLICAPTANTVAAITFHLATAKNNKNLRSCVNRLLEYACVDHESSVVIDIYIFAVISTAVLRPIPPLHKNSRYGI